MERERKLFETFLACHARKARPTDAPCAHVGFYRGTLEPNAPLIRMTTDELLEELDPESELVRWLLEQLRTYDCTSQRIVALVFDPRTVLSEVLRMPS